jgi:hypothetical protein
MPANPAPAMVPPELRSNSFHQVHRPAAGGRNHRALASRSALVASCGTPAFSSFRMRTDGFFAANFRRKPVVIAGVEAWMHMGSFDIGTVAVK